MSDYRPKELRHHVIVRTRPSVRVLTPSLTVGQGENASLQCEVAGGSPEPELSWARPGHSVSTSQVLEINTKTLDVTQIYHGQNIDSRNPSTYNIENIDFFEARGTSPAHSENCI